jgi:hypothetical protein
MRVGQVRDQDSIEVIQNCIEIRKDREANESLLRFAVMD